MTASNVQKTSFVVAIDGPAGTGKSSVTKRLADALGYTYVDTGALYRAIAYCALEKAQASGKENELEEQASSELARSIKLEFRHLPKKNPKNRIFADGRDLTGVIRTPDVSMAASKIATFPEVRNALKEMQRALGCAGDSILEGRDIGTVIFPDADVKVFLTATPDERAKRRLSELEAVGADSPSFEEMKKQIEDRDHQDSTRAVAPLKKAPDAIVVDTSSMTLDQVVGELERQIRKKRALMTKAEPTHT